MHKPPFLFVFAILVVSIIIIIIMPLSLSQSSYAQGMEFSVNRKAFAPGDSLAAFGKGIPSDALIVELFNPDGRLVLRTQIDVGPEGSFSKIIMIWPSVDTQKFSAGTYSLVVTSSTNAELRATEALVFQSAPTVVPSVERELEVDISVPSVVGRGEEATMVIQVTMGGVPVGGDPQETLKGSYIRSPNGTSSTIRSFTVIEDGVYLVSFSSNTLGLHTVHLKAIQGGLVATGVAGVQVEEGSVLLVGNEIARLSAKVDNLREETVGTIREINQAVSEMSQSVSEIGSAAGQVTSLLLPIIGMIAIIVALQATILARHK